MKMAKIANTVKSSKIANGNVKADHKSLKVINWVHFVNQSKLISNFQISVFFSAQNTFLSNKIVHKNGPILTNCHKTERNLLHTNQILNIFIAFNSTKIPKMVKYVL